MSRFYVLLTALSLRAVPEMTNSLPKPPKSPKPPSQSTGAQTKSEGGRGGEKSKVCNLWGQQTSTERFFPFLPLPGGTGSCSETLEPLVFVLTLHLEWLRLDQARRRERSCEQ